LTRRRTIQDWVVRPILRSIPGVADINSTGGFVKQYQVLADAARMRYFAITIEDVRNALMRNNANSGGGVLPEGPSNSWFVVSDSSATSTTSAPSSSKKSMEHLSL
jgi:Cu/Ag efflux pump CusA